MLAQDANVSLFVLISLVHILFTVNVTFNK